MHGFGRGLLLLACMPCIAVIIPQNDELVPKTRKDEDEEDDEEHEDEEDDDDDDNW